MILEGWFGDLADLRQEDEGTATYLLDWIGRMVRVTQERRRPLLLRPSSAVAEPALGLGAG